MSTVALTRSATVLAIVLLVSSAALLPAQEASPVQDTTAQDTTSFADTTQVESIRVGELFERIEAAAAELDEAETMIAAEDEIEQVEAVLPAVLDTLSMLEAELDSPTFESASLERVNDRRQVWLRQSFRLDEWHTGLNAWYPGLEAAREKASEIRAVWEAEATALRGGSETLLTRVGDLILRARGIEEQLNAQVDVAVRLETQISEGQALARDGFRRLDEAASSARQRLLVQDAPPIWRPLIAQGEFGLPNFRQIASEQWGTLRTYLVSARGRLLLHGLLFVVLAGLMTMVRRWGLDALEGSGADPVSIRVLSRPYSSALLLALIFGAELHPLRPIIFRDLMILLSTLPFLRLMPELPGRPLRRARYGLVTIFVIMTAISPLPPSPPRRFLIVLAEGLALFGFWWLLRRRKTGDVESDTRRSRLAATFVRLALLVTAFAVIATVFGWTNLGEFLTRRTLYGVYIGLLMLLTILILRALILAFASSKAGQSLHMFELHRTAVTNRLIQIVAWLLTIWWITWLFEIYEIWDPLVTTVRSVLGRPWHFGGLTLSLEGVLAAGFVLWLTVIVSRAVRFVLEVEILPRLDLERGAAYSVASVLHWAMLALGTVAAAGALGLRGTQLAVIGGALSIGIGFGLQEVVNNFVSGLILIFERPIKVGDKIEIEDLTGEVRHIGIRSSTVQTLEGAEVVVPNASLISNRLINWTLSSKRRRLEFPVGVAYGNDPKRVIDILKETAGTHPKVLNNPGTGAIFRGFGESSLDFSARFWVADFSDAVRVRSEVAVAICDALAEAGIEIPFPQREVHVREERGRTAGDD